MPVLSTAGAASLRAFGAFRRTSAASFIVATGGTVYVDPTDANYKIHQFTSGGTFSISACPVSATIQLMMVAGGGGGNDGGGGAGGYIYRPSFPVSVGSFSAVIGSAGGAGGQGGDTTFGGLVAIGGGAGGGAFWFDPSGGGGGSGGGGKRNRTGGPGLQPTSASGGLGNRGEDWWIEGYNGGGGGAGGAGSFLGGDGVTADIIDSSGTYAEFARGGAGSSAFTSYESPSPVANSGNGGWGGAYPPATTVGTGQAGIIRIRYKFQ